MYNNCPSIISGTILKMPSILKMHTSTSWSPNLFFFFLLYKYYISELKSCFLWTLSNHCFNAKTSQVILLAWVLAGRKERQTELEYKPQTYSEKYLLNDLFVRLCPTISKCSGHIVRLKEDVVLHQHNEIQVSKGSTFLPSGYSELCLQMLNCRHYGASSLLEGKKERKKSPIPKKTHRKKTKIQKPLNQRTFLGPRRESP